jgi:glycosyltransferase involved in cell wall biosynthesis
VLDSDVFPSNEIVENAIDGFILPPVDAKNWADKILFLLQNKDVCEVMERKGRQKVGTKYDIRHRLQSDSKRYMAICCPLLSRVSNSRHIHKHKSFRAAKLIDVIASFFYY